MAKELSFIERLKKELEKNKKASAQVSLMSDEENKIVYEPSGILLLDYLSGKGLPKGRWIEIFGAESGGKSLISALIGASFQKRGKNVVWIDMERTTDPEWFKRIGLDTDKVVLIKPESAEEVFDRLNDCIAAKADLVVIDSIASMATQTEMESDASQQTMAIMARMLSTQLRKLTSKLADAGTIVIMINQLRSTMAVNKYMAQETTTGGKALPFYCSLRFRVSRVTAPGSYLKDENDIYKAHTIKLRNIKNKVGAPGREGTFMLIYDGGPDNRTALVALAMQKGYITKGGAWYTLNVNGQEIRACGEQALITKLAENKEAQEFLFDALEIHPLYRNMFETDTRAIELPNGIDEIAESED